MTDGQGSSIRDGRGGVRVDGGDGRPDLRITDGHVRVTAPDGSQQRVDIPDRGDGSGTTRPGQGDGTAPARTGDGTTAPRQDGEAGTPRRDGDAGAPRQDGDSGEPRRDTDTDTDSDTSARPDRDGSRPGGDDGRRTPGDRDEPPVRALPNTRRAALEGIPFEVAKNALNLVTGLGADMFRVWADLWVNPVNGLNPDFMNDPKYWSQVAMQIGTAIPKGAAEARYGGDAGVPGEGPGGDIAGFPLEFAHQHSRNNLRDAYMEEEHPAPPELEGPQDVWEDMQASDEAEQEQGRAQDIRREIKVLDAMLSDDMNTELQGMRDEMSPEQRRTLDRFLEGAEEERDRLRLELDGLRGGEG